MPRLIYSATMSLDGYIAGAGGDMSWLAAHLGPNPEVDDLQRDIGSLLMGSRTFHGDDPHRGTEHEGAFEGTWSGPSVVLTHTPPATTTPDVTFADDLATAIAAAKTAAGRHHYVDVLGADVARQCLEAGELDEVLAVVAPVLLGDGTRLFDHPGGTEVRLEPIRVTQLPHATNLWFRVAERG